TADESGVGFWPRPVRALNDGRAILHLAEKWLDHLMPTANARQIRFIGTNSARIKVDNGRKESKDRGKRRRPPEQARVSKLRRGQQGNQVRRFRAQGFLLGVRKGLWLRRPNALSIPGVMRWVERGKARLPSATGTQVSGIWRRKPMKMRIFPRTRPD